MLNRQITQGRLTATPELKMTQNGTPVCSFTIASDEDRKREDGSRDTDFVNCVAWKSQAEFVSRYLTKGRLVIVEGRPKTRTYKDKNDVTHKVTELRVDAVYFSDSKREPDKPEDEQGFEISATGGGDFTDLGNDEDLPF